MKAGWAKVKLKDVCDKITQGPNPKYDKEGVENYRVLKTKNLYDSIIYYEDADKVSETVFNSCLSSELRNGDVLLAIVGQGSINKCNVFNNKTSYRFIYTRALGLLRTNELKINPYFLKFFLQSDVGKNLIDSGIGGTSGQQVVTTTHLKSLTIPLPPLTEQKQIVAILDEAFAGIDQAIANTENNLASARELFESTLNTIFTQKGDGWEEGNIDQLCVIGDGNHSSKYPKKTEMVRSGIPFIRGTNLVNGEISSDDVLYISEKKHQELKKGHLKTNDILFTNRGEIGKVAIVRDEFNGANLNSQIAWLRCKDRLVPEYLFFFLQSGLMRRHFLKEQSGAALQQFTITMIKKVIISYPPINNQIKIIVVLRNLLEKTKELEVLYITKLASLNQLKQSLLQKAFSGELTADTNKVSEAAE